MNNNFTKQPATYSCRDNKKSELMLMKHVTSVAAQTAHFQGSPNLMPTYRGLPEDKKLKLKLWRWTEIKLR